VTQLSARQTFYCKFILPVFWLGTFASGTVMMFVAPQLFHPPPPTWMRWQFVMFTLAGTAAFARFSLPLKRVRMDDQGLYVSNYLREIRVPLTDVQEVTQSGWLSTRPVTVLLWRESEFGRRIMFLPETSWRWWGVNPKVEELRAAVRRVTGVGT
jgi:hypothetical protein